MKHNNGWVDFIGRLIEGGLELIGHACCEFIAAIF